MNEKITSYFIDEITKIAARGEGMGVGGMRQGLGMPDSCVCPKCGKSYPKSGGSPCNLQTCTKCGVPLTSSGKKG